MGFVVICSLLRKVFGEQMLGSEVSALTEKLLALCSVPSISPAHAQLCCFIALHLISNVYVCPG